MKQLECCPKCGSENLENGEEFFEDDGLSIEVYCMKCGYVWVEIYKFIHSIDAKTDELLIPKGE